MIKTYSVVFLLIFFQFFIISFSQQTTIAIIATNDIHGTAFPTLMQRSDNGQNYTYGGLSYMGSIIQVIKQQYPNSTLYLDAGDQFQGGIQSSPSISMGKIMNDFYDAIDLNAQAVGNHEFDFGPQFLLPYYKSKQSNVVAANIRSQKGQGQFLPKQSLSKLYQFKSGIRVGVIGLSTIFTPQTTNAFKQKKFPQYKFLQYKDIVIGESKKLRKGGAGAVLILGHIGNDCDVNNTYGIWYNTTKQLDCDNTDQVSQLIDSLPTGTIDGVIQGHRHKFAHHYRKNIPYLGTINGGYYLNVLYLKFNKGILTQTKIQGPIAVCDKIFANYGTCQYLSKQRIKDAGQLIQYRFHNRVIKPHPKVQAIYQQQWSPKMTQYFQVLVQNQVFLYPQTQKQGQLGNLITNLMLQAVPSAQFVIINPGGLRTQWYPGFIQYQHFYNMFPFQNKLISFDILGSQLIQLLAIIQKGPLGFYITANFLINVAIDKNKNHKFINASFYNSQGNLQDIIPDKVYRGLSNDFLLEGGDDFKDVMGKVYTLRNSKNQGSIRQKLKPKLMNMRIIKQGSLIIKQKPRLVVTSQ